VAISDRIPNSKATGGATRRISAITIGVRHRRDLGDIEGLAASIVITAGMRATNTSRGPPTPPPKKKTPLERAG